MTRRRLPVFALVALAGAGCVPVVEPVGELDKAEPDKGLVGTWTVTKARGVAMVLDVKEVTVEAREVKGNPKGLMRGTFKQGDNENEFWFFTATVGKHTYANMITATDGPPPQFGEEGAFEKWQKQPKKNYFVFQYARDGDRLTIDCGDYDKFTDVMKDAKITGDGGKAIQYFDTPAGWLAKHLDKPGPATVFNGTNDMTLKR